MYIPRLRRINDVLAEIKAQDPETELTWKLVKRLIKDGKLTAVKFGNAWLINLDEFYGFFRTGGEMEYQT